MSVDVDCYHFSPESGLVMCHRGLQQLVSGIDFYITGVVFSLNGKLDTLGAPCGKNEQLL